MIRIFVVFRSPYRQLSESARLSVRYLGTFRAAEVLTLFE
jgi:hypothetical protein